MRAPTGRPSCEQVHGPLETCEPQNGKNNTPKKRNKRLYRLASKRASEQSRENPKTARGPEWHPEETPEQKDARPKQAKQNKAAGKNKKNNSKCGGVWCPVRPELCLFKKKEKEEKQTHDVVNPEPKTERTRQKSKT